MLSTLSAPPSEIGWMVHFVALGKLVVAVLRQERRPYARIAHGVFRLDVFGGRVLARINERLKVRFVSHEHAVFDRPFRQGRVGEGPFGHSFQTAHVSVHIGVARAVEQTRARQRPDPERRDEGRAAGVLSV